MQEEQKSFREKDTVSAQKIKAKRSIKDSVFSDLFQNKKYLLQLYKTLHPEDVEATENSLSDVTIENVLTDNLYNDLGFVANDKLMILMEAQSTWTVNILIRVLLYLAESYHEYFERTCQNLYKSRKVKMLKPELYVIYTGARGSKPDVLCLSEEFFDGLDIGIEVKVKVIYESETDDIINQYIVFSKIYDEQRKLYGSTKETVTETIRICKSQNVLKEYFESREREVVTIMMSLFDEEQIMKSYIRSERYEAEQASLKEAALTMVKLNKITLSDVKKCFPKLSDETIEEIEDELMQLM